MKKSLLTIALFLTAVYQAPASAQSMTPREDSSTSVSDSTAKTEPAAQNDRKESGKHKKKDKGAPAKEKTKKPSSEQETPYDPTAGIWG
jgi:hypothetical protein